MSDAIIVAVISGVCTLLSGMITITATIITNVLSHSKTLYRIEQLEKKQDKHNQLIERVYKLETKVEDMEREMND